MKIFRKIIIVLVIIFGVSGFFNSGLVDDLKGSVSKLYVSLLQTNMAEKKMKWANFMDERPKIAEKDIIYTNFIGDNVDLEQFKSLLVKLKRQNVENIVFVYEERDLSDFKMVVDEEFDDLVDFDFITMNVSNETIEELDNFVKKLTDNKANTVLFVFPSFSAGLNNGLNENGGVVNDLLAANIRDFHNHFNINVLKEFDLEALWRMDANEVSAIYVAMAFAEWNKAYNYELVGGKNIPELSEKEYLKNFINSGTGILSLSKGDNVIKSERSITIMAFGDMMLGRDVRTKMNVFGKDYIFSGLTRSYANFFKGSDFLFGNLEGPINGTGKSGGTAMNFSFNEDIAPFLKEYGFNILSIANNHSVDQGWEGRDTTIEALENSGIDWCGHPSDAEANSVFYKNIDGQTVAFVCLHDVSFSLDDDLAVELIQKVREKVDFLIVSIHWGYEYKHVPNYKSQFEPGRALIDAGADFIIGHHPHVVQSFEVYKGKFIFYSLGNFVFDQYWSTMTQEELGLGIVLDKDFTPVHLFAMKSHQAQSRLMNDVEYKLWIEEFIGYGEYDDDMKEMIRSGVLEFKKEL